MTNPSAPPASLFDHLLELRNSLLRSIVGALIVFCCLVYFAQDIYQYVAQPLLSAMPESSKMIATDVASPFFAPFKLTLVLSQRQVLNLPYHKFTFTSSSLSTSFKTDSGLNLKEFLIIKKAALRRKSGFENFYNFFQQASFL